MADICENLESLDLKKYIWSRSGLRLDRRQKYFPHNEFKGPKMAR